MKLQISCSFKNYFINDFIEISNHFVSLQTVCYNEENICKQIEIPYLIIVLLSVPSNKLPCSQGWRWYPDSVPIWIFSTNNIRGKKIGLFGHWPFFVIMFTTTIFNSKLKHFSFSSSQTLKFVEKIRKANWWKHQMNLLLGRNFQYLSKYQTAFLSSRSTKM